MDTNILNIRLFNSNLEFIGEIDYFTSCSFERKYDFYGEWEFHVGHYSDKLRNAKFIMLNNDPYSVGVIEHIENLREQQEDITIKGFTLEYFLSHRITIPPVGKAYHTFNTNVEDIIYQLVKVNLIDPIDTNRKVEFLKSDISKHRGPRIEFQTRYKDLDIEIQKLSKISNLGFRIKFDYKNKSFIFEVYEGKNLSAEQTELPPKIFNVEYDNIITEDYVESSIGHKSMAIVAGEGEGEKREIVLVHNELKGLERREVFVDARDLKTNESLAERGKIKLAEKAKVKSISATVDFKDYKDNWNLGDIVTTINKKFKVKENNRVSSVIEIWEGPNYTVEPTFGTTIPHPAEKIKELTNSFIQDNSPGPQGETGERGQQGYSVNYNWRGTELGIKREDEASFEYVNLRGSKGDVGPKGDKGDKGDRGLTGATGPEGPKGEVGPIGPQGKRGVQGPAGNGQSYVVFHEMFIATEGQTIFTWDDGYEYPIGINAIKVYLNGIRLTNRIFKEVRGNCIEFTAPLRSGDKVFIEAMQAVVDLQGPQGPKGDKGDTGLTGERGLQGAKGDQGPKGEKGEVGAQGPKGDKGETGPIGLQGPKGNTGAQGPQGVQGFRGEVGPRGPQGEKGDKGDKGDTGLQGPPGSTQSYIKFQKTFVVTEGQKLFSWNDGYTYNPNTNAISIYLNGIRLSNQIIKEINNHSFEFKAPLRNGDRVLIEAYQMVLDLRGPQGPKGDKGNTGSVGPQGARGLQGERGLTGATGPQGPKGDIGPRGIQGLKGDTGSRGPQGAKGNDGATPYVGSNGNWFIGSHDTGKPSRGVQGVQGPKGNTGPQGPIGHTGATGPQGPKGDVGPRGPKGDNGFIDGKCKDISGANCDDITYSGFFRGSNLKNKPSGCTQGWIYLISYAHDYHWIRQTAYDYRNPEQIYTRTKHDGVGWSEWVSLNGTEIIVSATQPSGHVKGRVWIDIN